MKHVNLKGKTYTFSGIYRGVVVDNVDPLLAGRVKIRVYPMFEGVDDKSLPWAIYSDAMFGGLANNGGIFIPEIDSHVWVFFEAGDHRYPVYFGAAPAIVEEIPDIPTLSRESEETVDAINDIVTTGVATGDDSSWDEPESAYAAEYPNNKVFRLTSGITVELDNTEGNERIHIYHPSGTRTEIDASGNKAVRVVSNDYEVIHGDQYVNVKGNCNLTVDSNCTTYIKGNWDIKVDGDKTETIGGNVTESYGGNQTTDAATVAITAGRIDLN